MNYTPIHTSIYPSYNYLAAENAFLKQDIEWKNAVLAEQQGKIESLQRANAELQHDALRWNKFKHIIDGQRGELTSRHLESIVDTGHRGGSSK